MNRTLAKGKPLVSIGMPVYNGAAYVRDAIGSLLKQTHADFELIISDNGSTDETGKICSEIARQDSRIRYVRQADNLGPTENFRAVLDLATGDYFMWAAADDRRSPDFVAYALRVFDTSRNCDLVFCDYEVQNHTNGNLSHADVGTAVAGKASTRYLLRLLSPCPSLIYGLHRTATLRKIPLEAYDYFDVHLTHWYAIFGTVKILPLPLYVAGVKGQLSPTGDRIPFCFNGRHVDPSRFFRAERQMLFKAFSWPVAIFLYVLLRIIYLKNVRAANDVIRSAREST